MATWSNMVRAEAADHGDDLTDFHSSISQQEMDREFYAGYGIENGTPFIGHSAARVYFCVCYDGSETVGSVPRNPNPNEKAQHFGG